MSIEISIAIFLVFLAGIITLQVFYFKTDRKLLLVPAAGLGAIGGIVALMLSTYYDTALERVKGEILFNYGQSIDQLADYENYILICIFAAVILFATIAVTAALILVKKVLDEKGILSLEGLEE